MRERKRLIMWREDHIGDPVGHIFLDPTAAESIRRLKRYFGEKVRLLKIELVGNKAHIEVECMRLEDESNRLVAAANDLRAKGMLRNARSLFNEALALDPINADALLGLGLLFAEQKDHAGAFAMLKRARETGGDAVNLLQALARLSLKLDRPGHAVGYLERAAELAPNDPAIRRALATLGTKPDAAGSAPGPGDLLSRDRRG